MQQARRQRQTSKIMAYNELTGLVTIDYENETFDEILDNVARALGDYRITTDPGFTARDVGILCLSPNINKWARFKPVEYPKNSPLLETEFKGTSEQNAENIYYGLQVPKSAPSTTLTEDLAEMHEATFEYVGKPTTWFRLSDFDGYSANAQPNPYASFNADSLVGYYDDSDFETGGLTGITVRYNDSNIRGVDFSTMLQDTNVTMNEVLTKTFPCILVTDSKGETFFTALYCKEDTGDNGPRPLLKDGIYAGANQYYVKFAKEVYSATAGLFEGPPWTSNQLGMKATIILVKSASASTPLLVTGGANFGTHWVHLDTLGHVSTGRPVVVPGGVGKELVLRRYNSAPIAFAPTRVIMGILGNNPRFIVNFADEYDGNTTETVTVEVAITLSSPEGGPYSTTLTYSGYPSTTGQLQATTAFITASNLLHSGTKTYTGEVTIRTTVGTKSEIKTMEFSETLTA